MCILIILITVLSLNTMIAQELEKHQWKNRLILVFSENEDSEDYKRQMIELQQNEKGLAERKLIVYQILPNTYKISELLNTSEDHWTHASNLYKRFITNNASFKIVLIGLDGSVKLIKKEFLETEILFNTIDAMPLRQLELRKK